ncbi:MAG TPA: DUF3488 and transglutaminase-like domain-containing protein [Blastocatellia bacterium]|nr:DUF3488 and transglutaminase-like domain-containing protein [Blastocatellia bacterium]
MTSYGLMATAFFALAMTGELDLVSMLLFPSALAASFYADARQGTRLRLREWMWRVLALAYIPFAFFDATVLSSHISALVHMTLFLSAAKLFQNKRDRDWVFLYLVAFFQMLLASGLTFKPSFVASLAIFLFFFVSALAAFEIRRARQEIEPGEEEIIPRPMSASRGKYRAKEAHPFRARRGVRRVPYLLGASFGQVFLVALLTLPFFFLIPRFGGGGIARGFGDTEALTGFSETVRLGEYASIKQNQRIIMRVQLDQKPARYLRWRGVALDLYEDNAWSVTSRENRLQSFSTAVGYGGRPSPDSQVITLSYTLNEIQMARARAGSHTIIEQKFMLEPLDSRRLFAAQVPIQFRGTVSPLIRDRLTDAISAPNVKGRLAYTVRSDISVPSEQELRADYPASSSVENKEEENLRRSYLRLPEIDPRVAKLAREVTRNAPTSYDKARAIEQYLKTEFEYKLDTLPTRSDPLAEFLFDTRTGHCEFFATAMAVMLRTLYIPARIVNGFQMGSYNSINGVYTVRASDAHSWVEVYFPHNDAWVEFDPTPAAGLNDYSEDGLLAGFWDYMDAAEVFWLDYIVTLDGEEQASIMVDLQHRLLSFKDSSLDYYSRAKLWVRDTIGSLLVERDWSIRDALKAAGVLSTLLASIVGIYVLLAFTKRRKLEPTGYGPWWHRLFVLPTWRSSRLVKSNHRTSALLFYEQMLAIASRAGMMKRPDQTPVEFAAQTGVAQIGEITKVYNRVRFGGARLDESEVRRVSALLSELKQSIKSR